MAPAVQPLDANQSGHERHDCQDLVLLFERCFAAEFSTVLVPGGVEPEYVPAEAGQFAQIIFTQDYFASALHETAHWCLAGARRRREPDYGYWYAPDGRTVAQQLEFERVEVKPQALEWVFATAADFPFQVSADNLSQGVGASDQFKRNIAAQAREYVMLGLPPRAARFTAALADFYGTDPGSYSFSVDKL